MGRELEGESAPTDCPISDAIVAAANHARKYGDQETENELLSILGYVSKGPNRPKAANLPRPDRP